MAKKDKKSKTAEQKARVAAKQSKKAAQKDKKVQSKRGDGSDAEDVDLEKVLQEYANQQAQYLKITEVLCDPPSARSSATLIGSPLNSKDLFLFGGELYNGAIATFFNDLYVYSIDKDEWHRVTSPNSPLPRSGHAWCRGGNAGGIYLFGGEFSSPKQGTFYHYNDFWKLEPSTREWTRLEFKGKTPPARSGHRMTYFKNYVLLFGGFQDTSQQTKYLQDLWIYDCQNYVWYNPVPPPATQKPDARSSFSFLPHDGGAVVYGGYSRVKSNTTAGTQTKGGTQGTRTVLKPMVHEDTWFLRITPPPTTATSSSPPTVRWERRKKAANAPNPSRAGATMAYHKGRGILFGGVHDIEQSEEGIDSEFFDTMYAWNIERNRCFQLTLRRTRIVKKQVHEQISGRRAKGKADEEELLRNLAALEANGSIADAGAMDIDSFVDKDEEQVKPVKPILLTMPHPRFNAQLAVQDDILYVYGGTYEHGDREYTFDEMWSIDLGKLDGVQEIFRRELENWQGSDEEDSDSQSDNEDDDFEDGDMDGDLSMGVLLPQAEIDVPSMSSEPSAQANQVPEGAEALEKSESVTEDTRPHPRPFETLRDFFTRTANDWQDVLLQALLCQERTLDKGVKELRKEAFELAETRWWDSREEITALEDEQEAAGIGEIVSMTDRGGAGGSGRRR